MWVMNAPRPANGQIASWHGDTVSPWPDGVAQPLNCHERLQVA